MATRRADARRNYARIIAVAEQEVAAHGADASLEQIARVAGVGSATVRRHFPSKRALLEAVFHERIEALYTRAHELSDAPDARTALLEWLGALTDYAASARGMAATLVLNGPDSAEHAQACSTRLVEAADPLLQRAIRTGSVAPTTTTADLLTLITGIALATEHHPAPATTAARMLSLTITGISPPPTAP